MDRITPAPDFSAPGDTPKETTSPYSSEQRRRKVLTYFQTMTAYFHEAAYKAAPTLTVFDTERIVALFGAYIDGYDGPGTKGQFRAGFRLWATGWIGRIAKLTVLAKPLLPALTRLAESTPGLGADDYQQVAARILNALPQYEGETTDAAALGEWASEWISRETRAIVELVVWVEKHRGIVYHGLWEVLSGCRDLGADESTADELSCDVWAWVAENVYLFLDSEVPVHLRFRELAVTFAKNWRSARVGDRNTFRPLERAESQQLRDLNQTMGVPRVKKAPIFQSEASVA